MAQRFWRKASFRIQPVLSPNLARHQGPSVDVMHSSVVTQVCVGTTPTTSASSRLGADVQVDQNLDAGTLRRGRRGLFRIQALGRKARIEAAAGPPGSLEHGRRAGNTDLLEDQGSARCSDALCFCRWTPAEVNLAPAPQA